jgi:signal transduction histidine kinase
MELPERARLKYRLDGADEDWVDASIPRVATYNHLRPGNYVFRVRDWNDAGVASSSEAMLRFRVPPAWNQTWWFFALLATSIATVAGGMAAVWQRRRNRMAAARAQAQFDALLAERRAQYQATLTERTRIAQDLHDTLLQGFAGVTLQLKVAELALPDEPDVAVETILRVQRLARESLREARERVWDMQAKPTDDLPSTLEAFAREQAAGTRIQVAVTTAGPRRRLAPNLEDAAYRIGREAVVNAIKHSRASRIEIEVEFSANSLRLEVRDDGRGFAREHGEEARRLGHFGLSGMRDRAAGAGGHCEVTSDVGAGTIVAFEIPLNETSQN